VPPAQESAAARPHRIQLQKLDKAWNEANARGWTVVSKKNDWTTVFPRVA